MGLVIAPMTTLANISYGTFERTDVSFRFEIPLRAAAIELADEFPRIKAELETLFGWKLIHRPTIVLMQNREMFHNLAGHPLIVAFAVPADNLIVIDYGRLNRRLQRSKNLLKHEMVHLLLHAHITGNRLHRWLEEGIAQWASDGVADLLEEPHNTVLTEAILSGKVLPFSVLADDFPYDNRALNLAYAQSRSIVFYIADTYGVDKIMKILDLMKEGAGLEESVRHSLSISLPELEKQWMHSEERPAAIIAMLAGYVYEILFLSAALMTVVGFIRFRIKKRRYVDEEDDS